MWASGSIVNKQQLIIIGYIEERKKENVNNAERYVDNFSFIFLSIFFPPHYIFIQYDDMCIIMYCVSEKKERCILYDYLPRAAYILYKYNLYNMYCVVAGLVCLQRTL